MSREGVVARILFFGKPVESDTAAKTAEPSVNCSMARLLLALVALKITRMRRNEGGAPILRHLIVLLVVEESAGGNVIARIVPRMALLLTVKLNTASVPSNPSTFVYE